MKTAVCCRCTVLLSGGRAARTRPALRVLKAYRPCNRWNQNVSTTRVSGRTQMWLLVPPDAGMNPPLAQYLLSINCVGCILRRFVPAETTAHRALSEQTVMEKMKIYLGLIAIWGMVAWMAWEFAWDAWQNARRNKRQRQRVSEGEPLQSSKPDPGSVEPTRSDKLAV